MYSKTTRKFNKRRLKSPNVFKPVLLLSIHPPVFMKIKVPNLAEIVDIEKERETS